MIIDVTGVEIVPGNFGKDCPGNGEHYDSDGNLIWCCCDECDYLLCCTEDNWEEACKTCFLTECPRCTVF
ncbi:MAG: hypothetical protein MRZ66_00025 [Clostridiales bacterium]|nr:hypothetical protein [Clostridiales bacterium]